MSQIPHIVALLVSGAALACTRPPPTQREVVITGQDYSFRAPDSLPPGRVLLRFHNAGLVRHEVAVGLLKPEFSLARALEVVRGGARPDSILEGSVGILVAGPGATALGALSVDLVPGRTYALVCAFQDGPDKPPHLALGMVHELKVSHP